MRLKRGDHVCAMYSKPAELANVVAQFLTDGLGHHEQCWYVASGDEADEIRAELEVLNVDVDAETARKARANPFYDSKTDCLSAVDEGDVLVKLQQLDRSHDSSPTSSC